MYPQTRLDISAVLWLMQPIRDKISVTLEPCPCEDFYIYLGVFDQE